MSQEILTVSVSQLNNYIKRVIENNSYLKNIWVKGEISNCKIHSSGHIYLTLKDENSVLRAVMFRGAAMGLRFTPEDGMKILARGRVSVYESGGQYQLYIEEMQPDGVGALHLAFEQLKTKLSEEGLFDERYKKPLPKYPQVVGVVTAATGAAVRDIIHVLGRRFPKALVRLRPVLVQGEGAATEIAEAIRFFNENKLADVLIVGRGGGSIEDLWAFNEEIVARAVFASEIPIISAVGHETDFTICDFVADRRAPTPSAAAEIAVPSVYELSEKLGAMQSLLSSAVMRSIERKRQKAERLSSSSALSSFPSRLDDFRMKLALTDQRLEQRIQKTLGQKAEELSVSIAKLDSLSPLKVLTRGYAYASTEDGTNLSSVHQVTDGDAILVRLSDGTLDCLVKGAQYEDTRN
ncbi:MAG: exodeoxyribonuclease VII large subunit [Clostridia bacterium]|nr:exodeoxyribonuclease VII large subunit [Clostridia bacterium]